MFKQQLSPRSVHPYQTTVVPISEQQFASAAQQRAKFPWAENAPVYHVAGTDSSTSDNAYHVSLTHQYGLLKAKSDNLLDIHTKSVILTMTYS